MRFLPWASLDIISTFSIHISVMPTRCWTFHPPHLRLDWASVNAHDHRGLRRRGAQQGFGQELAGNTVWLFWCEGSENRVNGSTPVLLSNLKLTNCVDAFCRQTSVPVSYSMVRFMAEASSVSERIAMGGDSSKS